jgi:hypothetical protein
VQEGQLRQQKLSQRKENFRNAKVYVASAEIEEG